MAHLVPDLDAGAVLRLLLLREVDEVLDRLVLADGGADVGALDVEGGDGHVPAAVLLAQPVLDGDAHVLKEDLVELVAAGHVHEWPDGDAGGVHGDDEVGDPLVLGDIGIGAGEHEDVLAHVGERRPDLLAVDDVVVAVADGLRLEGGEVGA